MTKLDLKPHTPVYFAMLVGIGAAITVATGFVHGRLTQRWGPVPDLQAAARELEALPRKIGDWEMLSEEPLDEAIQQILSCAGYVNRQYVNRQSGQTVSVAIIVGPSGPTAVHTPEICYSSRAYSIQEPRQKAVLTDKAGTAHSFWSLSFGSTNPAIDKLRVYYGWCPDVNGVWTASDSPRFEFAGRRLLFKLQIASMVSSLETDQVQDPCREFLTAFLRSTT